MNTAGPQLTDEQIESQFKPLLARFMADLKATATDPDNLRALRRKMTETLSYQERGGPDHRRKLKRQKYAEQNGGYCAICSRGVAPRWVLCGARPAQSPRRLYVREHAARASRVPHR